VQKEILTRRLRNVFSKTKFSKIKRPDTLPSIVHSHQSYMIKKAAGVDLTGQMNKATNIALACAKINGVTVKPGEVFSFWRLVGKTSKRKGYKAGRVLQRNKLITGVGGGLCNLANTIHLLILHSPLQVVEFHGHTDALAPDEGERVPFSAGTSVRYNYIDYRFKNNTDQAVQLALWCEDDTLFAELRSEREYPYRYALAEENHHFALENGVYYRNSLIYKESFDRATGQLADKELILRNHSEVLFDYALIPKEQIRVD